jgi:PhoH-like ATPase
LTGDHHQIDNPYIDSENNGLTIAAEKMRGNRLVGHIILSKGERSELANLAADKL